jgi:K+-sensing histidine kinase KdpD
MYNGNITLDLKYNYQSQKLRFEIKDTGIGIKDSEKEKINIILQKKMIKNIIGKQSEE